MTSPNASARQRNTTLDLCKAISAFGVVLVHFRLPGIVGELMASIGTTGVVMFFLLSGYAAYMPPEKAQKVLLRRFAKNLKLLLVTLGAYLLLSGIQHCIGGDFGTWVSRFADPLIWIKAALLGAFDLISGDAMWFMVALLYCYLIFWLLARFDLFAVAYKLLPVMLLLRIGMETYSNSFGADWHLSGNAIVGGLPVMLLGHYVAHRKVEFMNTDWRRLVPPALISLFLLFVSVNVKIFGLDVSQIFKISTAALAFLLCLVKANVSRPGCLIAIGQRYSTVIYLAHFMIGLLIKDVMLACGVTDAVLGWCLPPAAILCSVLFAALIDRLKQNKKTAA